MIIPILGLACCLLLLPTAGWGQDQLDSRPISPPRLRRAAAPPFNFHLVVTEDLLNRVVSRQEVQPGEVRDQFEDTPIAGQQVTSTQVRLDLLPSHGEARLVMRLDGETQSTTTGFSPQAAIHSLGRQQFHATKEILFDGWKFSTWHARVQVRAESQNVGAVTYFTGRPLGPLVEQIVLGVAEKRQPAAEAFARRRVVERVYPQFDQEIDAQLGNANRVLKETLQARLKQANLLPDRLQLRSTDRHLHFASSTAVPLEQGEVSRCPDELLIDAGIVVYLHESLLQGIIEQAKLAGTKTNNRDLIQMVKLLGLTPEIPENAVADLDVDIEFDEADPLVIRIGEEETRVILRAAFRPAGQAVLPKFEVTIPYRIQRDQDEWVISAGRVQARSLEAEALGSSVMEMAVTKVIEASLPKLRIPGTLSADLWPAGKQPPRISSIHSAGGWLVIGID